MTRSLPDSSLSGEASGRVGKPRHSAHRAEQRRFSGRSPPVRRFALAPLLALLAFATPAAAEPLPDDRDQLLASAGTVTELWLYTDPGYHDDDSEGVTPDPRPHRGRPVTKRFCGPAAAAQAARLLAATDSDPVCTLAPGTCSFFAPSDRVGAETRIIPRASGRWVIAQLAPGGPRPRVDRALATFVRRAKRCPR